MSSPSSPNQRVQSVLNSPAAERISRDASRLADASKRGYLRFQSVAGPATRRGAAVTAACSRRLAAQVATDARNTRAWARTRQLPSVSGTRVRIFLILLAAMVLVAAVSAVAIRMLGADEPASVAAPAEVGTPLIIENVSDGRDGRVFALASGQPLFPLPGGSLSSHADAPIEMQDALVISVIPDVGFWVGENPQQRVFVRMQLVKDSDTSTERLTLPDLQAGQTVNLSGYLRGNAASAETVGITDPTDAALYDRLNFTVDANSIRPQ